MNISNERKKKITHSINSTRERKKKKKTVVFTRSSTDLLVNSSLRLVTTQPIRGTIKRHFDKSYWILSLVSIIKDSSHLLNRRRVHVRAKKLKWRRREREREKKEKKNPSMIDRIEKAEWNIFHPFEKYKLQLGSKTLQLANQWPWKTPTSYNFPPPLFPVDRLGTMYDIFVRKVCNFEVESFERGSSGQIIRNLRGKCCVHFWVNTGSANQGTDPRFSGSSEILWANQVYAKRVEVERETSTSRL